MVEVMIENVPHWISERARDIADAYARNPPVDDKYASDALHELTNSELDLFASDRETGLAIVAYYDWHGAMCGLLGFEESPWSEFVDDVERTAKSYLEDDGYWFD